MGRLVNRYYLGPVLLLVFSGVLINMALQSKAESDRLWANLVRRQVAASVARASEPDARAMEGIRSLVEVLVRDSKLPLLVMVDGKTVRITGDLQNSTKEKVLEDGEAIFGLLSTLKALPYQVTLTQFAIGLPVDAAFYLSFDVASL